MRTTFFAAIFIVAAPSAAIAYCSEPSAPYCAAQFGSFNDEWDFDRCKNEMESYQSDIERYMSCRKDEAQQAIDDANRDNEKARAEYSEAVDGFNKRARGY